MGVLLKMKTKLEIKHDPVCPYCSADPIVLTARQLTFPNGIIVLLVTCLNPDCRKIVPVSFMGAQAPRVVGATVVPGGLIS